MEVSFLFHFYQPITQDTAVIKRIADTSYVPLLKLIKSKKYAKVTLNTPLSFLEGLEKAGYSQWLEDLKGLVTDERVELVGSGAYHPLLSKLPVDLIEKQIILNEFGLGYYFGRDTDFEGDPSILVKNLYGFFPPELAVNTSLVKVLDDMGYLWALVDEVAIPDEFNDKHGQRHGLYSLKGFNTLVVARNRSLSNVLSFKRDLDTKDFHDELRTSSVVALDAEFFGHHYKEGVYLLDLLMEELNSKKVELVSVSDFIENKKPTKMEVLLESTWAASDAYAKAGELYPKWDAKSNKIHKLQWEIISKLLKAYASLPGDKDLKLEGFENKPVWKKSVLKEIGNPRLELDLLVLKALHSDQFWWASQDSLENSWMIEGALDLLLSVAHKIDDSTLTKDIEKSTLKIRELIKQPIAQGK